MAESGWTIVATELGAAWMEWSSDGPIDLGLPGSTPPPGPPSDPPPGLRTFVRDLEAYWAGSGDLPALPGVGTSGSAFRDEVYRIVGAIPAGSTLTYAEVAEQAGRPGAARAVGAAMAANRLAPIVPCHRVVGSDGSLRGYAGGLQMKRHLLEMERARAR